MSTYHNSLKKLLSEKPGGRLAMSLFLSSNPKSRCSELEIIRKDELFLNGDFNGCKHRAPDSMMVVNTMTNKDDSFTIIVEIKTSVSRFIEDDKYTDYIGFTDYMLIAAPGDVAKEINSLVSDPRVGVADIKNGDIIRMPMRQQIQPDIDDYILRRVLLRHNIDNTRTFYNPSTDTITDEKTFLARR